MATDAKQIHTDWQHNWHASLATKITAPILWVIVLVSIAVAIFTQQNVRENLENTFIDNADKAAYQVGIILSDFKWQPETIRSYLQNYVDSGEFTSIVITWGEKTISIGSVSPEFIHVERPILVRGEKQETAYITVYQFAIDKLVKQERTNALLTIGLPFVLFGILLAGIIHSIVTRPIQKLVGVTRQVCEGDMSIRLDAKRIDEFGELEKFFNRMLDNLEKNHIELKNAAETAKTASHAKSAFLANMSHELRTPLNAIIGYTSLVEEFIADNGLDQCLGDTGRISNSAKHLLNLINDVLDLSKIEAGMLEICPENFALYPMLHEVIDLTQPMLFKNNNQVSIEVGKDIGDIRSDETKIHQVMLNLLSNAAKFTQDGQITVSCEKFMDNEIEYVRIVVQDTGIGMTPEQQDKIFNEFTQADLSTTKKYGGTGLGLSITKRFCEILGGHITVSSKLHEGSRFTVILPSKYQGH